ncbi:hypothetical protein EV421DRAFT_1918440 [Armillaria borealis]|uniref:Uncharacterized protein n=1 Tax=Armillaria borealis TaxID=47425 RepID=A0AA39K7R0_9AGAR|nr:hypothetical protein EV421DRAFT_1918440 [Armillaria borealis]
MSDSESDSCASFVSSILDSITRSSSNSSASSAPAVSEQHPILVELEKWEVNEATRQARQQAYTANAEAAMKDVLEEYKKWWVDNAEALAFYTVATVDTKAKAVLALLACSGSGEPELRTLQEKKGTQAKASRRDIATLIERGRIETARVKAETIPENPIRRSVKAFVQLHVLRDLLMHKYGREFSIAVMENHDGRVVRKLDIAMPSPELVNAYLTEIAKAYGVSWMSPNTPSSDDNIDDGSDGDVKQTAARTDSPPAYRPDTAAEPGPTLPAIPPSDIDGPDNKKSKSEDATTSVSKAQPATTETPEDEFEALNRRFAALKKK